MVYVTFKKQRLFKEIVVIGSNRALDLKAFFVVYLKYDAAIEHFK